VEIGQVNHIRVIADLKGTLTAITETIIEIDRVSSAVAPIRLASRRGTRN
jgi:hypothetical protein